MPPLFSGLGVLEIFLGGIARPGDDGEIDDLLLACGKLLVRWASVPELFLGSRDGLCGSDGRWGSGGLDRSG